MDVRLLEMSFWVSNWFIYWNWLENNQSLIIFIDKPRTNCPCFIVALSIDKLHNRILVDFKPFMYKNLRWCSLLYSKVNEVYLTLFPASTDYFNLRNKWFSLKKSVATVKIRNSIQQPNMGEIRVIRLSLVKQLEKYFASKVFCLKN